MTSLSTTRLALAGLALLCLLSCSRKEPEASADAAAPRSVKFVTIETRTLDSGITASGNLVAREEAAVAPQLSGYQIARVLADQGELVKAGQVLVELDDTLLRADIAQQQAAVAQATVAAQQAAQEAERVAGLDNTGVLSAEAIAQRRLGARTGQAQLEQAQAQLRGLEVRRSLMSVRAPVEGRILQRTARPGDVSSPATVLFRIARGGLVEVNAEIGEQNLGLVRPGQTAEVTLPGGRSITGTVRLVGAEIDPQTRLGRARIALPVREDVRVGGFATAVIKPAAKPVSAVRETAVSYGAQGASLMTLSEANAVAVTPVKTGRRGGGYVELIEGPPPGTRVLLGAQNFVLEGDTVQPVAAGPVDAASTVSAPAAVPPAAVPPATAR